MPNYAFEQGDIVDFSHVAKIFDKYNPDMVVHFAAESHVDRSILGPSEFVQTNIIGTLLNLFKQILLGLLICSRHAGKNGLTHTTLLSLKILSVKINCFTM